MESISQPVPRAQLLPLLQQAVGLHSAGDLARAEQIYREVLDQDPVHPVALHYLGIVLHQHRQHEEGLQRIRLSCALMPDNAGWLNDLGNVLFSLGEFEEAGEAYQSALAIDPQDHEVWNNLGSAHLQHGDTDSAIAAFSQAVELAPEFAPALIHLGNIHEAAGDKMTSAVYQCRAYVLPPLEGKSREMLGVSFYFLGRLEEAAAIYQTWLEDEPGHPIAQHMHAACSQIAVPSRASDSYIEWHFDRYAKTFNDNLLGSLGYRGPQLMGQGLASLGIGGKQYAILDIGCGTGLCAPFAAPYARSLIGVDLSGNMLEQARARGGYDQLIRQEITHYLSNQEHHFDIVLSADTLIYFGGLETVFCAVAGALQRGGFFLFTVEAVDPEAQQPTHYQLHASGRYRHSTDYVRQCLCEAGFSLLRIDATTLREEIRRPVPGMLVIATKN